MSGAYVYSTPGPDGLRLFDANIPTWVFAVMFAEDRNNASEITHGHLEVSRRRELKPAPSPIHRISALQKESQHKSSGELKSWAVVLLPYSS